MTLTPDNRLDLPVARERRVDFVCADRHRWDEGAALPTNSAKAGVGFIGSGHGAGNGEQINRNGDATQESGNALAQPFDTALSQVVGPSGDDRCECSIDGLGKPDLIAPGSTDGEVRKASVAPRSAGQNAITDEDETARTNRTVEMALGVNGKGRINTWSVGQARSVKPPVQALNIRRQQRAEQRHGKPLGHSRHRSPHKQEAA